MTRGHNLVKANEYAKAKIECEAALGEMLAQQLPHEGGWPSKQSPRATVSELGINKSQSSRWQLIAANADILPAGAGQIKD